MKVVTEFRLESKLFSISVDNASNNIVAIELLKNHFRPVFNGKLFIFVVYATLLTCVYRMI